MTEDFKPITRYYAYSKKMQEDKKQDEYSNNVKLISTSKDTVVNLISSRTSSTDNKHAPVIDLDVPCTLVPSSQPGHSHLYIDKEMTWQQYSQLLSVMVQAGIVEGGFYNTAQDNGFSAVRIPGGDVKPGVVPPKWIDNVKQLSELAYENYRLRMALREVAEMEQALVTLYAKTIDEVPTYSAETTFLLKSMLVETPTEVFIDAEIQELANAMHDTGDTAAKLEEIISNLFKKIQEKNFEFVNPQENADQVFDVIMDEVATFEGTQ